MPGGMGGPKKKIQKKKTYLSSTNVKNIWNEQKMSMIILDPKSDWVVWERMVDPKERPKVDKIKT